MPTLNETQLIENLRGEAFLRLGITEQMLADAPKITQQLRMIAKTIRGSGQFRERNVVTGKMARQGSAPYGPGADIHIAWPNYLEASDNADARKVRDAYYALPRYMRTRLPIEAFCVAAGVSPLTVLEILTAVIVRQGTQASTVIAAVNHPRVVEKTVEMAMTDDGIADRTMLHKHAGFLPSPSGPKTNIVVTQNASANAQAASVAAPPPEQTIRRLADRFNMVRALPEQVTEPMPKPMSREESVEHARSLSLEPEMGEVIEADDVREE